jgi:hypothetical protein
MGNGAILMHTYKKEKDGTYAVGQYLTMALESKFVTLFYVNTAQDAIAALSALNGADFSKTPIFPNFHIVHEYEPPKRNALKWFGNFMVGIVIAFVATILYRIVF